MLGLAGIWVLEADTYIYTQCLTRANFLIVCMSYIFCAKVVVY